MCDNEKLKNDLTFRPFGGNGGGKSSPDFTFKVGGRRGYVSLRGIL